MLRIHVSENAAAAKQYYREGLSTSDYYIEKGLTRGLWGGQGAKMLGLEGFVDPEQFDRLCDNLHPLTGEKLTPRTRKNRRVGYDFTFNAPKSVSVIYGIADADTRWLIRTAFESAIHQTFQEIEQEMYTRVRKKGQNTERLTGNMTWARFTHDTSRPIDGIPDPHLHAHCYAFNSTFDHVEQRWKAGEFGHIKEQAPYYEAVFHNHFARKLQRHGFDITPTKDRWEITGVSREVVNHFSQRTREINQIAADQNITDPKEKAKLAALTRRSKQELKSPSEIQENWHYRYRQAGGRPLDELRNIYPFQKARLPEVIDMTCEHLFERQSTASVKEVYRTALSFGVGSITHQEIHDELIRRGAMFNRREGKDYLTFPEILQEETRMLNFVRDGRGTRYPLHHGPIDIEADFLNDQQRAAVRETLTSIDTVSAIIGKAGAGKTTVLKEIKANLKRSGKDVYAFATSASAARDTLRAEGFAGAETIARLLHDKALQQRLKNNVMLIDEASLVGVKTMTKLFDIAKKQNARIILVGDPYQHHSVERGDALRLMDNYAGMRTARIEKIVRQKSSFFKWAVNSISKGKLKAAIEWLHTISAFTEIADTTKRYTELAESYFQAIRGKRSVMVVSPTNQEGQLVVQAIRERLKSAGILKGKEQTRFRLVPKHYSEGEKKRPNAYLAGDLIQLNQNVKGFKRGETLHVMSAAKDHLLVTASAKDEPRKLPLAKAKHFEVFSPEKINLAKGDRIRITRNGFTKYGRYRLNNGQDYTISRIKRNGDLILNNGYVLEKSFGHLQHGYVSTSFAAQSKTVDQVLIAQSRMSFGKASTKEQFYVSLSRGKHRVKIFTDDLKGLQNELTKNNQRLSATELTNQDKRSGWFSQLNQQVRRSQMKIRNHIKRLIPTRSQPQLNR